MKTSILKTRSFAELAISPSGEMLCASDAHDFFYAINLKTHNLVHEEQLEHDLESLRFEKSSQLLFLNDGIMTTARLVVKNFGELSFADIDAFEDPSGLTFLDSKITGEMLFFLPVNANLYKLDSINGKFNFLAHIPYDSICGRFFGKSQNKLILSALGHSKTTVISLEDASILENIPSIETWEYQGDLDSVSLDEEHFALSFKETISIFNSTLHETHTFKFPSFGDVWFTHKLSPDFDVIALSGNGGVYLFDVQSGKELNFCKMNLLQPNQLIFVPNSENKIIIGSFTDGDISLIDFG
jgi:hypothetical protein